MRNHVEWMRQIPGGESISGKTLMHQRQCADHTLILQIEVILADLIGQQHSLVYDSARRKRRYIETSPLFIGQAAHSVLCNLTDDK